MPKTKPPRRPKQKGDYQYKIPLDELEEMAKRHCTDDEIADYYGCTKDTIAKRKRNDPAFRAAYIKGKSSGKMSLRSLLWKSCLDGNVTAQIWMSKQHLGMRDVTALEHSGPSGQAIEVVNNADLKGATTDELLSMKKIWADIKRRRNAELASELHLPAEEAIDKELRERSLHQFIKDAWAVVEPSDRFIDNWHIQAVAEHLEAVSRSQIRNLVINMPPRHTKSLLVSVFWPCWEWITHPSRRWLYSSYASQLSIRDSIKCRRLIESAWYQSQWADRFFLAFDANTTRKFDTNHSGYRLATSVGGSATGEGGDRVVCDDPHNVQEAESDSVRKATLDWWDTVMSTRLNDPKTGAKVIVAQRCHEKDLSGHVLAQGGYEHLCLPAEFEKRGPKTIIGWVDPRIEPGELLNPERFGQPEIAELKLRLGSYAAAGQLQQRPAPAEGGLFKRQWWRFYKELPVKFDEIVQSWDCAFKETQTSDFVVGQVWGRVGADKYLLDQSRGRMDLPATLQAVVRISERWPAAQAKLIEDKANGPAVIQLLKSKITGLIAVNPEGGKEARANAITPQVESGNVYLPDPQRHPWVLDLIEECASFPNGAHDDQVDAMTQALIRMNKPKVLMLAIGGDAKPSNWGRMSG